MRASRSNHDSQWHRRGVRICGEGAYYLAVCAFVLLGSILRDVNLLLVVACMMLGPLVLNGIVASRLLRRIGIRRQVPASVPANSAWNLSYEVRNVTRSALWTLVFEDTLRDVTLPRAPGSRPNSRPTAESYLPYLAPGEVGHIEAPGELLPRGQYQLGPLTVRTRFPFGLLVASATLAHTDDLYVTPALGTLSAGWNSWLERAQRHGTGVGRRTGRFEGEFHSMRDWQAGDPRKWIHWRTTARRNKLMARDWETAENHDVAILLDLQRTTGSPSRDRTAQRSQEERALERLISFAASLVVKQCACRGARFMLGIAGQTADFCTGAAGPTLRQELLKRLAVAQSTNTSTWNDMLAQATASIPRNALVLVVGLHPPQQLDAPPADTPLITDGAPQHRFRRMVYVPVASPEFDAIFHLPTDGTNDGPAKTNLASGANPMPHAMPGLPGVSS